MTRKRPEQHSTRTEPIQPRPLPREPIDYPATALVFVGILSIFFIVITAAAVLTTPTPNDTTACPHAAPDAEYAVIHYPTHNKTYAAQLWPDGSLPPEECWKHEET